VVNKQKGEGNGTCLLPNIGQILLPQNKEEIDLVLLWRKQDFDQFFTMILSRKE